MPEICNITANIKEQEFIDMHMIQEVDNEIRPYLEGLTRVDGSTQYHHTGRVLNLLETQFGHEYGLTEGFIIGVLLHDIVDRNISPTYLLSPEKVDLDPEIYRYAIGIANSAKQIEAVAEEWRAESLARNNLPESIKAAILNSKSPVTREMLEYRAKLPSLKTMRETLEQWDLEGLLIKSAEVMDNISFPNLERPASAWMDAQELLSFYGPLLEVSGFQEMAQRCYDLSLRYLNGISMGEEWHYPNNIFPEEHVLMTERARVLHTQGEVIFRKYNGDIFSALAPIGRTISRPNKMKGLGSIAEKLKFSKTCQHNRPDYQGYIPDLNGWKIVIDDQRYVGTQFTQVLETTIKDTIQAIQHVTRGEYELGHTDPGEEAIEVTYGEPNDLDDNFLAEFQEKVIKPRRDSGYQAIHINFSNQSPNAFGDKLGLEIQITTESAEEINAHGAAHHVVYKTQKYGIGNGEELTEEEITELIQDIEWRSNYFIQSGANAAYRLTPNSWNMSRYYMPE